MKEYLVDVPVQINIWIRTDCQKRQWEVIKEARPSTLFIASDGGRNEKEWESIHSNRRMIDEGIDWECTVYRLYNDKNIGMYEMGKSIAELVWNKVDRCIFLEDDQIPSLCFFRYCQELLEKYKDDTRIYGICGMNHFGVSDNVTSDYFFARDGSIWGTATWKRCFNLNTFSYYKDPYIMDILKRRTKRNRQCWKKLNSYAKGELFEGHVPGAEFWKELSFYTQGMVQIIPKYNMINNIGLGSDSAHFDSIKMLPKKIRPLFNMKTYEYDFPLKHPVCVIPDDYYAKKVDGVLGYNHPFVQFFRYLEMVLYRALHKSSSKKQ